MSSEVELKEVKPVRIRLEVINRSNVNGVGTATLVGIQKGVVIYRKSMPVYDRPGGDPTTFTFPSYLPRVSGVIVWTVTLTDNNPDSDVSVRFTNVKGRRDRHDPRDYPDYSDRHAQD